MKALSKENTPFVNEVAPADQNNNVQDENNKGSNKEVNLDDSLEKKLVMFILFSVKIFVIMVGCSWRGGLVVSFTWLVSGWKVQVKSWQVSMVLRHTHLTFIFLSSPGSGDSRVSCVLKHRWRNLTNAREELS